MKDFKPGQRWICDVDLQLGLGTVQSVEERMVRIIFMTTGETRTYARQSAPLTRVIFNVGDTIMNRDGIVVQILSIQEEDGLFIYSGQNEHGNHFTISEQQLAHHLQFNRPIERLLNQHIDADKWFRVRYQTWLQKSRLASAPLYGLLGTRTSLIPHQLYIAYEVGRRYAPRVLLADEVGLGKTIEAGMILHQQLLTERAKRILIVVPETLIHQWLVEMLRRFNLHFSIFDEERYTAIEESCTGENPFHSEQLILCSLRFLCHSPQHFQAALNGDWDLLVVDEAHHLEWSEQSSSPAYQVIEQLAAQTSGVLLLTATPEQLGKAGHFARLRLLDPNRFADFQHFVAEEQAYEPIANAVEALLGEQQPDETTRKTILAIENSTQTNSLLSSLEKTATDTEQNKQARQILAALLLDRHGTGRLLFRNTRAAVKGFPERKLFVAPLPLPDYYDECLTVFESGTLSEPQLLLYPELLYQASAVTEYPAWTEIDPRISWLYNTMRQLKPEKILVITASAQTARDIAQVLKTLTSQHFPVFHEHMSLLERDRAAAFFADRETGCQVLICSEIGSEGRNFQFAHHLVLFDLPFNPDMLEQRIGRLDRIGQTETINIHVPYLLNSAQAIMLNWYHQGLNALAKICPAGQTVFQQFEKQLITALHLRDPDSNDFSELITHTQKTSQILGEALDRGRDRLLEYNSFRPQIAKQLYQTALSQDKNNSLQRYMDIAFDCFGVHVEEHRSKSYRIEPSEHMTSAFPGLHDEGIVITYKRSEALANEDWQFLTWEHPMVIHAMDRITGNETGNATVSSFSHRDAQPGILFLECLFVLEISTTHTATGSHILPSIMIRTIIDEQGCSDYPALDHATVNQCLETISQDIAKQVIELKKDVIQEMVAASEQLASAQIPTLSRQTRDQTHAVFTTEIERLKALQKINPNVRPEEIHFFEQQLANLIQVLDTARIRLDAIRVIVAT
ncbi:RNA polymerase-associated protein RapA [Nitrosomonas aestuarii]|uniref:RNA polymerase-associated protein RapA n=1 Tax=Nitrosomonas aestuarii TaxID=52441 RepID=UPI000D3237E6|nr:RNA polymerase-associated protein RapA [Nitrosomonas aestuarii]PTN12098.1 ATP-dependent helicase HepA [Nitrosomonas aestuarii]